MLAASFCSFDAMATRPVHQHQQQQESTAQVVAEKVMRRIEIAKVGLYPPPLRECFCDKEVMLITFRLLEIFKTAWLSQALKLKTAGRIVH